MRAGTARCHTIHRHQLQGRRERCRDAAVVFKRYKKQGEWVSDKDARTDTASKQPVCKDGAGGGAEGVKVKERVGPKPRSGGHTV